MDNVTKKIDIEEIEKDIVKLIEADGDLPEDFSPYGEGYKVEKSRFLGDTDPEK